MPNLDEGKIALVKEAVAEWSSGKLTAERAMYAIHAVVNIETNVSDRFMEWMCGVIKEQESHEEQIL